MLDRKIAVKILTFLIDNPGRDSEKEVARGIDMPVKEVAIAMDELDHYVEIWSYYNLVVKELEAHYGTSLKNL